MNRLSQSLLTTSFTEDELLEAALKAGKPEFYPVFTFQVAKGNRDNTVYLAGKIEQEMFEGQTSTDYRFTDLKMELTSDSAYINEDNTIIYGTNRDGTMVEKAAPIVASDGSSLAVQLDTIGAYSIELEGTTGTIMVQFTYDVVTSRSLLNTKVKEAQILQVYVTLVTLEDGSIGANYEVVEASEVSELY